MHRIEKSFSHRDSSIFKHEFFNTCQLLIRKNFHFFEYTIFDRIEDVKVRNALWRYKNLKRHWSLIIYR